MTKILNLYNHHREVIGTAEYTKKFIVNVRYNDEIHYSDISVSLDEFDDYRARMDVKLETELEQLTMKLF